MSLWAALPFWGAVAMAPAALPQEPMGVLQIRQMDVNGVRLTYQEQGQGTPVVFIHGSLTDLRAWDSQREAVAAQHRFIALTQRYYGTAPWPDDGSNFSAATHLEDLTAFLQGLNAGPVELVGWSYGGSLALLTAILHPELVRGLFLYEPLTGPVTSDAAGPKTAPGERGSKAASATEQEQAGKPIKAVQIMAGEIAREITRLTGGFSALPPLFQDMYRDNARTLSIDFAAPPPPPLTCDQLGQIKQPVTIARGEMTWPFFRVAADAVARCIPGARRVIVPGARHIAMIRQAPVFNKALLDFLQEDDTAAVTGSTR